MTYIFSKTGNNKKALRRYFQFSTSSHPTKKLSICETLRCMAKFAERQHNRLLPLNQ